MFALCVTLSLQFFFGPTVGTDARPVSDDAWTDHAHFVRTQIFPGAMLAIHPTHDEAVNTAVGQLLAYADATEATLAAISGLQKAVIP